MGIREAIARIFQRKEEERMGYSRQTDLDMETRDNYLRSLRRQRQRQLEEVEKENLIRKINEFEKEKSRKYMWGIKDLGTHDKQERIDRLKKAAIMRRKIDILKQKNHYKINKKETTGFFGKGLV